MSPEQWRGEKVDGRADQYALGVLAFELLAGKRPFADASMQELLRMHLAEDPPDIVSFRRDLPSHTTDAVWRALAKDPADRYESATAFVEALSGDMSATASRPRVAPSLPNTAVSGQVTVKHVTPAPKSPRVSTARVSPSRPPAAPVAPASSGGRFPWIAVVMLLVIGGSLGAILVERQRRNAAAPVAVAPASSPLADSIAALQKLEADENARLQREVDDARKVALEAEHKMELMSQARAPKTVAPAAAEGAKSQAPPPAPVEPPHAHIIVLARGGSPRVLIDGTPTVNSAPTVVEVPPGKHEVTVQGAQGNVFSPPSYTLDLAPNDTQQVVFVSQRAAQFQRQRQQALDSARRVKKP
jgi:serine/threonine-protein kinase